MGGERPKPYFLTAQKQFTDRKPHLPILIIMKMKPIAVAVVVNMRRGRGRAPLLRLAPAFQPFFYLRPWAPPLRPIGPIHRVNPVTSSSFMTDIEHASERALVSPSERATLEGPIPRGPIPGDESTPGSPPNPSPGGPIPPPVPPVPPPQGPFRPWGPPGPPMPHPEDPPWVPRAPTTRSITWTTSPAPRSAASWSTSRTPSRTR